ncbi:methyl-accepting chemotaxis protein, partial [Cryptosporangium aurantiacum]
MTAPVNETSPNGRSGRFAGLSVMHKIMVVVWVVALVAIITGGVAWVRMNTLDEKVQGLNRDNIYRLNQVTLMQGSLADMYVAFVLYNQTTVPAEKTTYENGVKAAQTSLNESFAAYQERPDNSAEWKKQVTAFDESWTQYIATLNTLVFSDTPPSGVTVATGAAASASLGTNQQAFNEAIDALQKLENAQASQDGEDASSAASGAKTLIAIVLVVGLIVAMALAIVVGRGIARRLARVGEVLDAVADGDLTRRADADSGDEVGRMARAVNRASESIRQTVATLSSSARALAESSQQLSASAEAIAANSQETSTQTGLLASASEDVSRSVQTVAAGSEEMGAAIREISQSANDAAGVASQAVTAASATNATVA